MFARAGQFQDAFNKINFSSEAVATIRVRLQNFGARRNYGRRLTLAAELALEASKKGLDLAVQRLIRSVASNVGTVYDRMVEQASQSAGELSSPSDREKIKEEVLTKTLASLRTEFMGVEEDFKRDVREVTRELAKKLVGLQVRASHFLSATTAGLAMWRRCLYLTAYPIRAIELLPVTHVGVCFESSVPRFLPPDLAVFTALIPCVHSPRGEPQSEKMSETALVASTGAGGPSPSMQQQHDSFVSAVTSGQVPMDAPLSDHL